MMSILEGLVTKFENPCFKVFGEGNSDTRCESNPLWM